ncbi:hypothetical protein GE21DRAFT_1108732 [Neurospora crassa]|nr:hypothetical protein GE21DRAFT_1108732 [Neurospora crassa]
MNSHVGVGVTYIYSSTTSLQLAQCLNTSGSYLLRITSLPLTMTLLPHPRVVFYITRFLHRIIRFILQQQAGRMNGRGHVFPLDDRQATLSVTRRRPRASHSR